MTDPLFLASGAVASAALLAVVASVLWALSAQRAFRERQDAREHTERVLAMFKSASMSEYNASRLQKADPPAVKKPEVGMRTPISPDAQRRMKAAGFSPHVPEDVEAWQEMVGRMTGAQQFVPHLGADLINQSGAGTPTLSMPDKDCIGGMPDDDEEVAS